MLRYDIASLVCVGRVGYKNGECSLSAANCKVERNAFVGACKLVVNGRNPTPECCRCIQVSHFECICPVITPKVVAPIDVRRPMRLFIFEIILNPLFLVVIVLYMSLNKAASELIKANMEPIFEQYRPVILSSLKFSKVTLGTVAPQFTEIRSMESRSMEIIS
ncbi:hypothetical protein RJ639_043337 [Escallonia herrerae]|uniref:Uncharacterized protein n=1 Tax=Escallonia herrerae TaxID=1293975 RepID=A0AA88WIS1_9ASTE|nr:hypothetical protein RJ639_043337 [Escallonia herrerae]